MNAPFLATGGALAGALVADLLATRGLPPLIKGERLGPFVLVEEIGRGGHGVVWRAERDDRAFDQTVAIKIVKAGAGLRARFLRERAVLGQLVHAHIVRILDAGERDDGLLWFAMEHVSGEPADRYFATQCDWRAGLAVLIAVARAVEHAHRHLIVHGDLTPGNILVAADNMPRLLDFGIARRLDDADSGSTVLYTPGFASPEQRAGQALTTASDTFQIGMLVQRWLLEARGPQPPGWARRLLKCVVARATAEEPLQRQAQLSELRIDLELIRDSATPRHVPIAYSLQIAVFLRRHGRAALLMLVLLTLLGVIASQQWSQYRYERERLAQEARSSREVSAFMSSLFSAANPNENGGRRVDAEEILHRGAQRVTRDLSGQPRLKANLSLVMADAYLQLGRTDAAESLVQQALSLHDDGDASAFARALEAQALLRHRQGRFAEALQAADAGIVASAYLNDVLLRADLGSRRGNALKSLGRLDDAMVEFDTSIALVREEGADTDTLARLYNNRGLIQMKVKRVSAAREDFERALAIYTRRYGEDHPLWSGAASNLGWALGELQELDAATELIRRRLKVSARTYGEESVEFANDLNVLGGILANQKRHAEAAVEFARSAAIWRKALGADHPAPLYPLHNLGWQRLMLGEAKAAVELLTEVEAQRLRLLGAEHVDTADAQVDLGDAFVALGHRSDARAAYTRALTTYTAIAQTPPERLAELRARLAAVAPPPAATR
ncbi:MAG: tetratricopeptide repeat protein [Rhodanobacteraceae bacterium]|nr:tetratricopeptide repeat protein [Rhodanobacteraceae bacterium]